MAALQQHVRDHHSEVAPYSGHFNLLKRELREPQCTQDGKTFFFRTLTPCDESLQGGCRIPDEWSGESVALESRFDGVIMPPDNLADGKLWDAIVVSLPLPEVAYMYCIRESGQPWPIPADPLTRGHWEVVTYPITEAGAWSGQWDGTGQVPRGPQLGTLSESHRGVFKGLTITHVASQFTNEGMSYALQYTHNPVARVDLPPGGNIAVTAGPFQELQTWERIPVEPQQMFAKSGGTVLLQAREGSYLPLRFSAPTHPWQQSSSYGGRANFTYQISDGSVVQLNMNQLVKVGDPPTEASYYGLFNKAIDLNVGVQLFTGLNKAASLNVKVKQGIESLPTPNSAWAGFTQTAPMLDRKAIDAVRQVSHKLELAYPARYNSLGWLLNAVRGVANTLLPGLIDSIGGWAKGQGQRILAPGSGVPNV